MKKYLILLFIFCSTSVFAQFKISGKIKNYTGHEDLKVNIPVVYGYSDANSVKIHVAKDGSFSTTLPIKEQKFADLMFRQTFHVLLLSPGKDLTIELNEADGKFKILKGTSLIENNLLQTLNIEEYPFFLQNSDTYIALSLADMQAKMVKPYFAVRDKKIALINNAAITPRNKKLITAELKSAAYNNLYELIEVSSQYRKTVDALIIDVFNKASVKPEALPAGPKYYKFANNYLGYIHTKTNLNKQSQPLSPMTRFALAIKYLPDAVTEQITYQHIMLAYYNKDKASAEALAKVFNDRFPKSNYTADIKKKISLL
ncbi:MAG: hypothetical protein V4560_02305 [Bacteroidota bacterium]